MKRHAQEYRLYYEDWLTNDQPWKLWEIRVFNDGCGGDWGEWRAMNPTWANDFGNENVEFRRKPRPIIIGKYNLPRPMTKEPVLDQFVYAFTPENKSGYDGFYYNRNIPPQVALFKNGCFHEEQDHARQWADWWREVVLSQLG
jgi:hypothetical protein